MNRLKVFRKIGLLALVGILSSLPGIGSAADYDLFMTPGTSDASRPNVLIILDNTANWSQNARTDYGTTKFDFEQAALEAFFNSLAPVGDGPSRYDVGLMLFSETGYDNEIGADNADPSGGYVRYAIREMNQTNSQALGNLISNLTNRNIPHAPPPDTGNNAEYALAMHEAYLYFKGQTARSGIKAKTDSGDPLVIDSDLNYDPNDNGAWSHVVHHIYASPSADDVCGKNYVIFISNGAPDNGENNTAEDLLDDLGGTLVTDPIDLNPGGRQQNWSDEYARFMVQHDIHTYSIDVLPVSNGQGPDNTALLKSMASKGEGRYFAVDSDSDPAEQLQNILNTIFNEIQAVNTVFASSALPVSVNVRGANENQVYLGMFRPEATRTPRWLGNLKEYQLLLDGTTKQLYLGDVNNIPVQSPVTGFVVSDAVSFWTHDSSYWEFGPRGTPVSASDAPDGEVVEKGAAAQRQRDAFWYRRFYTCLSCGSGDDLSDHRFSRFNAGITSAMLGVADSDEREDLIAWVRGLDNTETAERDDEGVRPSVHGDIVHASPALVNYGNDLIVAYYGANDGLYRAVRAGKDNDGTDGYGASGTEMWAFIAEEFLGDLKRLRDNSVLIKVPHDKPDDPDTNADDTDRNRDFFFDGGTAVYRKDVDDNGIIEPDEGDRVYLYIVARRGGPLIYALDVTDPADPEFLWKHANTDTDWTELGQTWSLPAVVTVKVGADNVPVLVFGAGYDSADDTTPAGTAARGRGIFVVRADNGTILRQFGPADHADMLYSIPSLVAVVDMGDDGLADVGYVGDTGGQIWRINFDNSTGSVGDWTLSKFAVLGNTAADQDRRKFLFPPDLLRFGENCSAAAGENTLAVLIGSGDREHPLAMSVYNTVFGSSLEETANRFYLLKDADALAPVGSVITESHLTDATATTTVDLATEDTEATPTPCGTASCGWLVQLASGEKVVGGALTLNGQTFFGTSLPPAVTLDPDTCDGNLGTARAYQVNYCNAAPVGYVSGTLSTQRYVTIPGGGLLPSPVPAVIKAEDGKIHLAVVEGLTVFDTGTGSASENSRIFWYRELED